MNYDVEIHNPQTGAVVYTSNREPYRLAHLGLEFWVNELDGWYGGAGVDASDAQRKVGHGMLSNPVRRAARTLTFKGTMISDDPLNRDAALLHLSGIFGLGEIVALFVKGEYLKAGCEVRIDGAIKVTLLGENAASFEVPLVAPDPFVYGYTKFIQLFPAGEGAALRYPLFAPEPTGVLSFGDKPAQAATITGAGTVGARIKYTVRGDWTSGFRITAGKNIIEYPYPVYSNAPVMIDNDRGSVLISGMDQTYLLTRREWHAPTTNDPFTVQVESLAPASGWVDVEFEARYV